MNMSLRTKILLSSLLPLVGIVLTLEVVLIIALYQARIDSTWRLMSTSVQLSANELDAENARAGDVAASIALAQTNGLFGQRAQSLEFIRQVLQASPGLQGVFLAYAADTEGGATARGVDAGKLVPEVNLDALAADGRFLPYWSRTKTAPATLVLRPDVRSRDRLADVTQAGGSLRAVAEPEVREGRTIVEHTSPIVIDGKLQGVAGVSRAVDDIEEALRKRAVLPSAEFILVSARGRILAATMDRTLDGRRIEDSPYAALLGRLAREGAIDELTVLYDPVSAERRIYAGASVASSDWRLLLSVPHQEIVGPVQRRVVQILLFFLGGVLLSAIVSMLFLRRIIVRVEQAATAVGRVAEGDLSHEIDSAVGDESGEMLRSIGHMVRSLQKLISRAKLSSLQLVSSATDISAAVQKQRDVSTHLGESTNQVAASTNEITATSKELLQTMNEVSRASTETAEIASRGRADLERMESIMQHLSTATVSISSKLAVISERANKIGSVVTTINRVAEQTNLLSLNAAIEAEKAGEYGLGFSVVAREIRRLADQTAIATLGIERIVSEMQGSVSSGVMEMDRFDDQVREGVREATGLSEQMSVIIEGVENLRPRFELAQQSMQAQVAGAGQINDAMRRLREIAISSDASSEELQAAMTQLLAAIESLKSELARFRTVSTPSGNS